MSGSVVDNAATIAAIRGNVPQNKLENPADILGKWQNLSNAQSENDLIKANTANVQQETAIKRQGAVSGYAAAMETEMARDPSLGADWVKDHLQGAVQRNLLPQNVVDQLSAKVSTQSRDQIIQELHLIGNAGMPPNTQQEMNIQLKKRDYSPTAAGGSTIINAGPTNQEMLNAQPGQVLPLTPVQEIAHSPSADLRAGQNPAASGAQISNLLSGGKQQQPSTSPGSNTYPVPQTQPGLSNGRYPSAAQPVSGSSSESDYANPATYKPSSTITSGMTADPREVARWKTNVEQHIKDNSTLQSLQDNERSTLQAVGDLNSGIITGPGTPMYNTLQGYISVLNQELGNAGSDQVKRSALIGDFKKNVARMGLNSPGAIDSVANLVAAGHANMSEIMDTLTNKHLGSLLTGQNRQLQLGILAGELDPKNSDKAKLWASAKTDPMGLAINTMTKEQQAEYVKSISHNPGALKKYIESVKIAQRYHLLDNGPPVNPYGTGQ